jgi:hypothetical protein
MREITHFWQEGSCAQNGESTSLHRRHREPRSNLRAWARRHR